MNELEKARGEINEIDCAMAELFERRMRAVESVIAYKLENGLPVLDNTREKTVIEQGVSRIQTTAYRPYYRDFIVHLMELSKQHQRRIAGQDTVAYQGSEGAYSHIALRSLFPHAKELCCPSFEEVFRAVQSGEAACGVLPFENSYTGEVGETLDLLHQYDLHISAVYDEKISHCLLGVKGAGLSDIKQVYSHPQGLAQCARFLKRFPFEQVPYANTALAAQYVGGTGDRSKAAIASRETAELYGLDVLEEDINTSAENTTRFVVLKRELNPTGNRFSLIFTLDHSAGQLAAVLEMVASHGFNMESIRSKSLKNLPWQYYFYVELVGDAASPEAQALMAEIKTHCRECKLLGVYEK